jgi:hypothetical protein
MSHHVFPFAALVAILIATVTAIVLATISRAKKTGSKSYGDDFIASADGSGPHHHGNHHGGHGSGHDGGGGHGGDGGGGTH